MIRVSLFLSGRLVTKSNFERAEVVIGRDPSCDLVIDNLGISRHHAKIVRAADGWIVEDLDSSNGVHVGGSRVQKHPLLSEDEFGIGKYAIKFEELSASPVAAAVEEDPGESPLALTDAYGDMTFALDRNDLQKILERAKSPTPLKTGAARLTRIRPKKPSMIVPILRSHYVLGKAKGCDVLLKGWFTPKRAALIVQEGGREMVISLADSKRVKVNGKKVDSRSLADGDTIQIGRNIFVYSR